MIPGFQSLYTHELAHMCVKEFGIRSTLCTDVSIEHRE